MDRNKYREMLLQKLEGASIQSGGDEVVCKCKYCPDKFDHYHMYVSVPKSEAELSYFNCFLCHTSGIVTYNKLMEWGIYDDYWNMEITSHNAKAVNSSITSFNDYYSTRFKVIHPINYDTVTNLNKLDYINNRLGTNLTIEDCTANKIVLNLIDLLRYNRIDTITRDERIVRALSENFIGFLSYDNNFINMRNLTSPGTVYKTIDESYINYNIFGSKDNTRKFIIYPNEINTAKLIKVHIAEGPFDALSVKYNLRRDPNDLYCAVTGNAYKGLIRELIKNIGLMNIEFHLYLDNDKAGFYVLKDLLNELKIFPFQIYSHINTIGKDMGVDISKIKEHVEQLK